MKKEKNIIIKKISSYILILSMILNNIAPVLVVHAKGDDIKKFNDEDMITIGAELYYANGMKNNLVGSGDVDVNHFSANYIISTREFNKENPVTIFYQGYKFDEKTNYRYELSYTLEETDDKGVHISHVIKSGTFIGSEFNDEGLTYNVEFQDESLWSVNLTVFNNDDLVYVYGVGFVYVDMEIIANVKLKSFNEYLFKELSHNPFRTSYLTTNTEQLEIEINGVGLEDDKDYNYTILARNESDEEQDGSLMSGTIKGSEINKGTAVIKYNKMLSYPKDYLIYISFEELMFGEGQIFIEVIKSKEYLDNGDSYSIDNLNGFIKGTFYDKNSSMILSEINFKNNHIAKIFTKDGEETSGVVATGMIAKIYNGNGDVKIDMEIVIKGDITGNGNITLTDTVKMKRTVAGLESLTGVYAAAGDINDDGKISLTDAIKVTRHFAGIEEIK